MLPNKCVFVQHLESEVSRWLILKPNTEGHDHACLLHSLKTPLLILHLISATGRVDYATFAIYRTRRIKLWLAHICCALYIEQHSETITTRVTHFYETITAE